MRWFWLLNVNMGTLGNCSSVRLNVTQHVPECPHLGSRIGLIHSSCIPIRSPPLVLTLVKIKTQIAAAVFYGTSSLAIM
jgi:hypothetical protein